MSTSMDVYKIPVQYKELENYEDEHLEYETDEEDFENLIFTLSYFDCCNIITGLFDLTMDKQVSGSGLFEGKYIIKLEEFLKAKKSYYETHNKRFLIENYGIEETDFKLIHEELERFFNEVEPIILLENKLYIRIG